MAGFEVVVRPVVLPNIRPTPARSLPPAADPEKGFCVIKGNGGHQVDLSYSFSESRSQSKPVETERRVDEARVYQMDDSETVNKDNFIDIQVANRIKSDHGKQPFRGFNGDDLVPTVPGRGFTGDDWYTEDKRTQFYERIKEKKNIEIKRENVILRKGEEV